MFESKHLKKSFIIKQASARTILKKYKMLKVLAVYNITLTYCDLTVLQTRRTDVLVIPLVFRLIRPQIGRFGVMIQN